MLKSWFCPKCFSSFSVLIYSFAEIRFCPICGNNSIYYADKERAGDKVEGRLRKPATNGPPMLVKGNIDLEGGGE